jgi:hypothetical protein
MDFLPLRVTDACRACDDRSIRECGTVGLIQEGMRICMLMLMLILMLMMLILMGRWTYEWGRRLRISPTGRISPIRWRTEWHWHVLGDRLTRERVMCGRWERECTDRCRRCDLRTLSQSMAMSTTRRGGRCHGSMCGCHLSGRWRINPARTTSKLFALRLFFPRVARGFWFRDGRSEDRFFALGWLRVF